MNIITECFNNFKRIPKSQKVSVLLLLSGLLLMPITSIMILYSVSNFETIIDSIKVPNQYVSLNIDIEDPSSMSVIIAYSIYNPSMFPITNVQLDVNLQVNYINKFTYENKTLLIYADHAPLPDCRPFQLTEEFYIGFYSSFLIDNLITFNDNYDSFSPVKFYMCLSFSANYFNSLIGFNITHYNLDLSTI